MCNGCVCVFFGLSECECVCVCVCLSTSVCDCVDCLCVYWTPGGQVLYACCLGHVCLDELMSLVGHDGEFIESNPRL